jgi:hypothetical protein
MKRTIQWPSLICRNQLLRRAAHFCISMYEYVTDMGDSFSQRISTASAKSDDSIHTSVLF